MEKENNTISIRVTDVIKTIDAFSEQMKKIVDAILNGFRVVQKRVRPAIEILLSTPVGLARPPTFNKLVFNVKPPRLVDTILGGFILL